MSQIHKIFSEEDFHLSPKIGGVTSLPKWPQRGRLRQMIKERAVWLTLRSMEKERDEVLVPKNELVAEIRKQYPKKFSTDISVLRAFDTLVPDFILHTGGGCVETVSKGDDYFFWPIFWNRALSDTGIWKIITIIFTVIGVVLSLIGIFLAGVSIGLFTNPKPQPTDQLLESINSLIQELQLEHLSPQKG